MGLLRSLFKKRKKQISVPGINLAENNPVDQLIKVISKDPADIPKQITENEQSLLKGNDIEALMAAEEAGRTKDRTLLNPLIISMFRWYRCPEKIIWALGEIGDVKAVKFLCAKLLFYSNDSLKSGFDRNSMQERKIFEALGNLNAQNAVSIIAEFLKQYKDYKTSDEWVNKLAIRSLGRLKNKLAINILTEYLNTKYKIEAAEALEEITPELNELELDQDGVEEKIRRNIKILLADSEDKKRFEAFCRLIRMKKKLTRDHFKKIYHDNCFREGCPGYYSVYAIIDILKKLVESEDQLFDIFVSGITLSRGSALWAGVCIMGLGVLGDVRAIDYIKKIDLKESRFSERETGLGFIKNVINNSLNSLENKKEMDEVRIQPRSLWLRIARRDYDWILPCDDQSILEQNIAPLTNNDKQLDPAEILRTIENDIRELGVVPGTKLVFSEHD